MKTTILFLMISTSVFAKEKHETLPVVLLEKESRDANLSTQEAVYVFTFKNISDDNSKRIIEYSIDGKVGKKQLIDNRYLEFKTTPGAHSFMFYYTSDYYEVKTDSLLIKPGYRNEYSVHFENAHEIYVTEKPVIYCYPQKEQEVSIKLSCPGASLFTYPEYNEGWNVTASPDGTLYIDDKPYNYLFWESFSSKPFDQSRITGGFVVPGDETVDFLEEKLTLAGLNSKEQADFITYWAPRLRRNSFNLIQFVFNEDCNEFAQLDIRPQPDNLYRIYMLWHGLEREIRIQEQRIIPMDRSGFTVLEWGGQELNSAIKPTKNPL